ncbi:PH domain-containing protein [Kineosporia sp. R_H_3]|uniref:PH domain-containing protein n=1 Tax=Kineosporia sp. R_H_3 TaxID=1961848 RepID=UPI000B4BA8CB|nr:PH domain-containing protein [Kineosporia sp. R_H_3]
MSEHPASPRAAEPFEPDGVRWSAVSPRLASARRVSGCVPLAVLGLGCAVAALVVPWSQFWLPAGFFLAATVWTWWLAGRQAAAWAYAEQEDDLLVRSGIMFRRIVVVPYGRMQFVDVHAGPVDRLFRIARVQLHTASAASDAAIPGLPPEEAARLRDRLSSRGQSRLAGL